MIACYNSWWTLPTVVTQHDNLALIQELKAAMFLTGSRSIEDIAKVPLIISGKTRDTLEARGFNWKSYAQR